MKAKHSAATLKQLALEGALAGCEARAFAAFHDGTLCAITHIAYVEAFVLQLGAPAQHAHILAHLSACDRGFQRSGKIAYKPPGAALLTSVLDVARWVGARLDGGLAHAQMLDRSRRSDAGGMRLAPAAMLSMALTPAELTLAEPPAPLALWPLVPPIPTAVPLPDAPVPAATLTEPTSSAKPRAVPAKSLEDLPTESVPTTILRPAATPLAMPTVAMRALEQQQLLVPRAATLDLIARHTRLIADYIARKAIVGDAAAVVRMANGEPPLFSLLDRGTQDRKELEALVCAALRERGGILAFTAAEFLLDAELIALLGEADRCEGNRRADAYLVVVDEDAVGATAITFDAFAAVAASRTATVHFFKRAFHTGCVVGVTIKSDLGLRNRRSTSGALHLYRCPIVLWALPRVNERASAMSDIVVYANVRGRFSLTPTGGVCYVGPQPARSAVRADEGQRVLATLEELR